MKSTGSSYDYVRSFERLTEILDSSETGYREREDLPSRDELTFANGFYVRTVALFVDIRKSSLLTSRYGFPKLAKLYRAFISEVVAVLDGHADCEEINIVGDGVWGVFDARHKSQVDDALDAAAQISTLIEALNDRLISRGYERLYVGIGLEWGRALMVKSGYFGSGINEVVYMGDVVNAAAKLCSHGDEELILGVRRPRVMAGSGFVSNLERDRYRDFFTYNASLGCYEAGVNFGDMEAWRKSHPAD
jgi:class 3 adenylate cyclase